MRFTNKGKIQTLNVRIPFQIRRMLEEVCTARGEQFSDFVRRALYKELAHLSFLDNQTKKALGVSSGRKFSR